VIGKFYELKDEFKLSEIDVINKMKEDYDLELTIEDKEEIALNLIKKSLSEWDKPFISWSGGKDSLVVMHLVHRVNNNIPLIFADTGVNHPSIRELKKYYEREEGKEIISTTGERDYTFWDIIEEFGWPIGARSSASKKAVSKCCDLLKKKPMEETTKGYNLEFNGLTAYESWTRYCRAKGDGNYKFVKSRGKNGRQVCMPIAWWHTDNVWDYIEKYDIEYPEIYDKEVEGFTKRGVREKTKGIEMDRKAIRVGCWSCPLPMQYSSHVMRQLRTHYPNLWKTLMDKGLAEEVVKRKLGGQSTLIDGFYTKEKEEDWLKRRPCWFDKI